MTSDRTSFKELERLMRAALDIVADKLSNQDLTDVVEYLDHGEYGVAYELLIFVLDKQRIARPAQLIQAGEKMGIAS